MSIKYVKIESDGDVSEEIHIELKDVRYHHSVTEIHLSLKEANKLLSELSKKLCNMPF